MEPERGAATAIDLFCGAGGATQGLKDAGVRVLAGIECDPVAADTYRKNHPEVQLLEQDIRKVQPTTLRSTLGLVAGGLDVLKSCPPCQPYSTLSRSTDQTNGDDLVAQTITWVQAFQPKVVLIENVPGIRHSMGLKKLEEGLSQLQYDLVARLVTADKFGVPQTRRRWIGLAYRPATAEIDAETIFQPLNGRELGRRSDAAHQLGRLLPATPERRDPLHRPRSTPDLVQRRISAVPAGGDRFSLPDDLRLTCHETVGRNASGPYGRIPLEGPGPTITTRCTTPSCGRFVHPTLDRPLTLREAAVLQTFPRCYRFSGNRGEVERQIGNAVPVRLVKIIATRILHAISASS